MTIPAGLPALNFVRLAAEKGKAPTRILLLKDGDINWAGLSGFELDQETAERIISAFTTHGADLPIDYHHSTTGVETGKQAKAPAAGWIKRLEYVQGEGLYAAEVEWTPEAKGEIEAKAYKYISPVINCEKGTTNIDELHSVALTNRPRTIGAPELLAAAKLLEPEKESKNMDKQKEWIAGTIKNVLRIKAAEDQSLPALDESAKGISDVIAALRGAGVDVDPNASLPALMAVIAEYVISTSGDAPEEAPEEEAPPEEAEKVDSNKAAEAVKAGQVDELQKEVKALREQADAVEAEKQGGRIETLIQGAIESNRLNPNDEKGVSAVRALAEKDLDACTTMIASIEPYAAVGSQTAQGGNAGRGQRERLILAASREYDGDALMQAAGAPSRRSYVNVALEDENETALTDAESEKMEVVS